MHCLDIIPRETSDLESRMCFPLMRVLFSCCAARLLLARCASRGVNRSFVRQCVLMRHQDLFDVAHLHAKTLQLIQKRGIGFRRISSTVNEPQTVGAHLRVHIDAAERLVRQRNGQAKKPRDNLFGHRNASSFISCVLLLLPPVLRTSTMIRPGACSGSWSNGS
jgi:hypothetical protein